MLNFRKKDDFSAENVVNIEDNTNNAELAEALDEALTAICEGNEPNLAPFPATFYAPLKKFSEIYNKRNEAALDRAVDLSVNASNSMAAVALITGDVRDTESQSSTMAAAIEELDASIGQIAQTAQRSSATMTDANQLMTNGRDNMHKTNLSAQGLSDSMVEMENQTETVVNTVKQIGSFVNTIDEIASQTNLLALNATIEAARAGDAGKGFAVVASEVKALSNATQKATEDINNRITGLQNDVERLLKSFNIAKSSISDTQKLTEETEGSIDQIASLVDETASSMEHIASILSEQTQATEELAEGVTKIAEGSVKASSKANEVIEAVSGSESVIDEMFTALDSRNIKNYVLKRAKSDHFLWKKNLANMLVGLNSLKESELADHHSCRLGKWCNSSLDVVITAHPAFRKLEKPHSEVHQFGKLAAKEFSMGNKSASHKAFRQMQEASEQVVDILDQLVER